MLRSSLLSRSRRAVAAACLRSSALPPALSDAVLLRAAATHHGRHAAPLLAAPWCPPAALRGFAGSCLLGGRLPGATPGPPSPLAAHTRGFAKGIQLGGKMKLPSSFKERFKRTKNGHFLRMRVGKRHCATAKSRPQRRRLRRKALVPNGRAKIMRKLGFTFAGSGR